MIETSIERLTEGNPQLTREWKGRLTPRNLTIATGISLVGQLLVYMCFRNALPTVTGFNRYCSGRAPEGAYPNPGYLGDRYCIQDLLGNWMILDRLWWLDIFVTLSVLGIFALLVVGTYQLIADIASEERRGTLDFIRLSPRRGRDIFSGKIFGVPILLYWVALLAVPFHLASGLAAGVPLVELASFYGVALVGCAFFYGVAIVFALATRWLGGFQPWLGSGAVSLFVLFTASLTLSGYLRDHTPFDWLAQFYPGFLLPYLVKATYLPPDAVGYLDSQNLSGLSWYGQPLWRSFPGAVGFILLNFGVWAYWLTRALRRRFHDPLTPLVSKAQSYGMTGCFCVFSSGFVFQTMETSYLWDNFQVLIALFGIYCLFLVFALSPSRQAVRDWARYRHLNGERGITALLFNEKSPAVVAIAANGAIALLFFTPLAFVALLSDLGALLLGGFLLTINMTLVYATIAASVLLSGSDKRSRLNARTIAALVLLPLVCFGVLGVSPSRFPLLWSFSVFPFLAASHVTSTSIGLAILGQWLTLVVTGGILARQVRQLGASASGVLSASGK